MGIANLARRLLRAAPPEHQRAPKPSEQLSFYDQIPDRTRLEDCLDRQQCTVAGEVFEVGASKVGTKAGAHLCPPGFGAQLQDDSGGRISLCWPGRDDVHGIREGAFLVAIGTVGKALGGRGLVMLSPNYTLIDRGSGG